MKTDKKHPMLLARAAALLAEEYPEIAFSACQLQNMCKKRTIPCMVMPTCGMSRKYRHMVHYPTLVKHLQNCIQPVIQ